MLFGAAPIGKDPSDERNSILAHMASEMGYTEWEWDLLANLAAWLPNRHHGDWQQAWCDVWRFLELFYKIEVQEPEDERENPDHDETEKIEKPDSPVKVDPPVTEVKERYDRDFHGHQAWVKVSPPSDATKSEWEKEAKKGKATSAQPPLEVTPVPSPHEEEVTPPRQPFLEPVENTPEKVAKPMAKVILAADKRLQAKMSKTKKGANQPREDQNETKAEGQPKSAGTTKGKKNPKQKKDISKGPMQVAMNKFFTKARSTGMRHRDIQQAWMKSKSRARIIAAMPAAERRKRRFA